MLTTFLSPMPEEGAKAHPTLTPKPHALWSADTERGGSNRNPAQRDYERTCTPENGCALPEAARVGHGPGSLVILSEKE